MNDNEPLSEDDYKSIERAGHVLTEKGWARVYTLNEMLDAWQDLVETLETEEYDSTFAYEWDHDLRCRDWLHVAWPILTHRIQKLRLPELQALDDRYHEATIPIRTSGQSSSDPRDLRSRWWHSRRPRPIHINHPQDDLPEGWSPPETPIP